MKLYINVINSCVAGPTELEILTNLEEIAELSLPLDKLKRQYNDINTAKNLILNRVTFCQSRVDVSKFYCHYLSHCLLFS